MLEEAKYVGKVIRMGAGRSEENGHPFVELLFEVDKGVHQGDRVRWRGYLHTEAVRGRTVESLQHTGWKGERVADLKRVGWQGVGTKLATIVVRHDIDRNDASRKYPRVAFVNSLLDLNIQNPTSLEDLATFDEDANAAAFVDGLPSVAVPAHDPETGELTAN